MKLLLASLAHVHGVGVAVRNHGRFVRVTADVKHDFHYVGHDWENIISLFRKDLRLSPDSPKPGRTYGGFISVLVWTRDDNETENKQKYHKRISLFTENKQFSLRSEKYSS